MIGSIFEKVKSKYDISLVPYEQLTITSNLGKENIRSSLRYKLEWKETFWVTTIHEKSLKTYEGWIKNDEFKFQKILRNYYNAFNPIVSGNINSETDRITIYITIKLHKFVSIFLIGFILFGLILFDVNNFGSSLLFLMVPYLICLVGYNIESRFVKDDLRNLFLKTDENKKYEK